MYVCMCVCVCVAVQWSPCGNMLASAGFDAITCIWDRRGGGQSISHAIDTFITCGLRVNYRTRTINIRS